MATFAELKSEYEHLFATMTVRIERTGTVDRIARKLLGHKAQYLTVSAKTGVPWYVIAALHNRESDADFTTYLGNGEPLNRVTHLVPKGRGPFATWEAGAIDALKLDGLDQVREWTPARACFEIEKFNGFGYRRRGIPSPYLWSFSNHYERGKYVADGQFSATAVDQQCGAIPVMKRLMEVEGQKPEPLPQPVPVPPAPQPKPQPPVQPLPQQPKPQPKTWLQILLDAILSIFKGPRT
jgi:lysozyme family protein